MTAKPHPLIRRVAAAQATLDAFKDKPFRYGTRDCVRMMAYHLRRMGYQVKLPASGSYASIRTAVKALEARGFTSLAQAMDSFGFPRIPPAAAIAGDALLLAGDTILGEALHVALGNGRVVGYHEDAEGAAVLQPVEYLAAWRIEPR
jgi:hypothetical protein